MVYQIRQMVYQMVYQITFPGLGTLFCMLSCLLMRFWIICSDKFRSEGRLAKWCTKWCAKPVWGLFLYVFVSLQPSIESFVRFHVICSDKFRFFIVESMF